MNFEDKFKHLPTYLNPEEKKDLFNELKSFPENIDQRIYSSHPSLSGDIIYQGDLIDSQPIIFLPDKTIREKRVFVISNTCDVDLEKEKVKKSNVVYCPVISYSTYEKLAIKHYGNQQIANDHLISIKKQRITDMFYLPSNGNIIESIVLFDSVNNHKLTHEFFNNSVSNKVISLSNYGFYLFLVKLSIHFTRVEESVNRG